MNQHRNLAPRRRCRLIGGLLTLAALTGTPVAPAAGESTVDARQLGIMEGVLHFCGAIDAAASSALQDKVKGLTQGATAERVSQARASSEYQSGFAVIESITGQGDEQTVKKLCSTQTANP